MTVERSNVEAALVVLGCGECAYRAFVRAGVRADDFERPAHRRVGSEKEMVVAVVTRVMGCEGRRIADALRKAKQAPALTEMACLAE